jgi:DNA-binding LytR/AlgR family response regulator
MAIINSLLVDDEPPALRILERYIAEVDSLKLAGSCSNIFKAMEYLQNEKIDLIFLDIKMPKLSGLDFIRTLPNPPRIIFTTAYKEFATDAFDLDAVDYLVKPFSFERFLKAVNKILFQNIHLMDENTFKNTPLFLYVRAERRMIKVFIDEILYVESIKDYIKIHLEGKNPLIVKQTISNLEAMLQGNAFVRIHRSFIVSLSKITAYTSKDVEIGEVELPIGRVYSGMFSKLLKGNS